MADWLYTLNTVDEAPFAWNPLHERFRIPRGISTKEITPGVYAEVRCPCSPVELSPNGIQGTIDR